MNLSLGVVLSIGAYIGIGVAVAFVAQIVGLLRIDPKMRGAPIRIRLLVVPGCVAVWPMVLRILLSAQQSESTSAAVRQQRLHFYVWIVLMPIVLIGIVLLLGRAGHTSGVRQATLEVSP